MATVTEVGPRLGIAPTCAALGLPRATYYRWQRPPRVRLQRRPSPRALRAEEQTAVLAVLHEKRFVDLAPAEVYATLLDEGQYLCSERTMYRLLAAHREVRERRNQLRHPHYTAPELMCPASTTCEYGRQLHVSIVVTTSGDSRGYLDPCPIHPYRSWSLWGGRFEADPPGVPAVHASASFVGFSPPASPRPPWRCLAASLR